MQSVLMLPAGVLESARGGQKDEELGYSWKVSDVCSKVGCCV